MRLVVWELPNGAGIQAQALDASTQAPISDRLSLGRQPTGDNQPQTGAVNTRPAVAGLSDGDGAVFLVAWHAEILDPGSGVGLGTEIVSQRVAVDDDGIADIGPLLRIRVNDDVDAASTSEIRSAPVVVANGNDDEFLVLFTHWPEGKIPQGDSINGGLYFIFGKEIRKDGTFVGSPGEATVLDLPSIESPPARHDTNVIFLAATPLTNAAGYLLAWSDPAQEGEGNPAQLYTKFLPASIVDTDANARNAIGDSTSITKGTGRIALAPMPDNDGYLLAFEDTRGLAPLQGVLLDDEGKVDGPAFHLLDEMLNSDDTFLSPVLLPVPGENRILLYAAVGNHSIDGEVPIEDLAPTSMRLIRRVLDPEDLAFNRIVEDFSTAADEYPLVNIYFAAQSHAGGALPDDKGAATFALVPGTATIGVSEFRFATEPPPPPPPGDDNVVESGGGALFTLLFLLPFIHPKRTACVLVGGLLCTTTATGAPPDVELLHSEKDGASCYRSVMYREVSEIRLAKSYNKTPIPAGQSIEIVSLPSGWNAEVITERNYQFVKLDPAPFDTVSGISIGRVCLKFPAMKASAETMPYTYDLVATGSPIMATARADDGVSDDELRAMIKRGERLKKGDVLDKPKDIDRTLKTLKRAKDLFN